MFQGGPKTIFRNCLITNPKTFPISSRSISFDLILEKFTEFLFEIRFGPFLWRCWWWRSRCWWWCRCSVCNGGWAWTRCNFRLKPHVGQNLANAFFDFGTKRSKTWIDRKKKENIVFIPCNLWDPITIIQLLGIERWFYTVYHKMIKCIKYEVMKYSKYSTTLQGCLM